MNIDDLTGNELKFLLLVLCDSYSAHSGITYMSKEYGISRPTLTKVLDSLINKGLIEEVRPYFYDRSKERRFTISGIGKEFLLNLQVNMSKKLP